MKEKIYYASHNQKRAEMAICRRKFDGIKGKHRQFNIIN